MDRTQKIERVHAATRALGIVVTHDPKMQAARDELFAALGDLLPGEEQATLDDTKPLVPDGRIARMIAETLKLDAEAPKEPWSVFEQDCECWVTGAERLMNDEGAMPRPVAALVVRYRTLAPALARELETAVAHGIAVQDTNEGLAAEIGKLATELREQERRATFWRALPEADRQLAIATMREASGGLGLAIGRAHWWQALLALVEPGAGGI